MLTQATIDELNLPDSRMRIVLRVQGQRTVLTMPQPVRIAARPGDRIQLDVRSNKSEWWIRAMIYPTKDSSCTETGMPILLRYVIEEDTLLTAMRTP